jgi:hypothetical protein
MKQDDPNKVKALGAFIAFTAVGLITIAYFVCQEVMDNSVDNGSRAFWNTLFTNNRVAPVLDKMHKNWDEKKDGFEAENKKEEGNVDQRKQ